MKLQRAVALRISNLLIKNNMTRYALCKKIVMPEQTLKNIIDERNKDIQLSTIAKIADGFGLSIEEFFHDGLFDKEVLDIDWWGIMKLTEAISKKVQDLLSERNIKQYYLFKNGGMPRSTISNVINCQKKRVSTDTVYQICTTLGITLEEFFADPIFENLDD